MSFVSNAIYIELLAGVFENESTDGSTITLEISVDSKVMDKLKSEMSLSFRFGFELIVEISSIDMGVLEYLSVLSETLLIYSI